MAKRLAYGELELRVSGLVPGDHLCHIYETEEEHRTWLMPFIRQGLKRGEKVVYIVDAHTPEEVLILCVTTEWKQDPVWKVDNWPFSQLIKYICGEGSLILIV